MVTDEDVLLVRSSVTMRQVAEYYNIEIKKGGMACCPLHSGDKTPSLKIYPGTRGYYCFGCHAGGDVIDFVMHHDGLEFRDAVKRLASIFGIALSDGNDVTDAAKARLAAMKREQDAAKKARISVEKQLGDIADRIRLFEYWMTFCEPLDGLWCVLVEKVQRLDAMWEELADQHDQYKRKE